MINLFIENEYITFVYFLNLFNKLDLEKNILIPIKKNNYLF